ncbi:polysaccharide deacetylase family protein [Massilia horti]|uniref:NodB homology domain-containing protein n=1 Tax=Massilia horti TaxID=2562153 RepID=A0A4Y9T5J8_9BURK|nr:polysaccharide deacetylase family protein [Massilia horti]TFW36317.1 hypothetical protein E4O92_00050 [Massilia horti]
MNTVFTCSFDDGHPSDMKLAGLLVKYGLNATFFIPHRNREGLPVMSTGQLRELALQFEIGSHTLDHCYLRTVDKDEAVRQITEGKKKLEDQLGAAVHGFCYPGGSYNAPHAQMVKAAGFEYARTTVNLRFDAGDRDYEMPTTIQFYPHPSSVYLRNFIRGGNWDRRTNGLRLALQFKDWNERLIALFDYACEQKALFHLWGHSWEIDALDAWPVIDRFLAHVAERVVRQNRLTNRQLAARTYSA